MAVEDLHVQPRDKIGHRTAKALRQEGRIPAIFYAHGEDSIPLIVDGKTLQKIMQREVNILNVIFPNGNERKSILREIQRDPVTDELIHVDIMGIKLTENVRLSIPILLVGTPVGVKEGGILEHLLREVEIEGLPLEIPEHIEVDVSELDIGDVITLEDVTIKKGKIVTDIHHAVANVIMPKVMKVEEVKVEEELMEEEVLEEEEKEKEETPAKEDEQEQS